jgi:renalase
MLAAISGGRAADGTGQNWVAPAGVNAISKHLLETSGATVSLSRRVSGIERVEGAGGAARWRVRTADATPAPGACADDAPAAGAAASGAPPAGDGEFDAVVLTLPVPQLLALEGEVPALLAASPDRLDALRAVQYSSRFALSLFWARDDAAARAFFDAREWACFYFDAQEEPALVFASRCAAKRGRVSDEPPSLVVHSSVPFALARRGADADAAGAEMLAALRARWPDMPAPLEARTTLWALSQVRRPLAGAPAALALGDGPPLIVAGDALSRHGSRFDGCVESARRAAQLLGEQLGLPAPRPAGVEAA